MKTQDEINKAAESHSVLGYTPMKENENSQYIIDVANNSFTSGATFANGYSVEEMCEFAEWAESNCHKTGKKWIISDRQVKTNDLLKLWEESR